MSVLGTSRFARVLATSSVLLLFLTGCARAAGGGTDTSDDTSQGTDDETNAGDSDSDGDDGGDGGGGGVVDPCALVSDEVLTAALGSPPAPDPELFQGGGSQTCLIQGTGPSARLSLEVISNVNPDRFEVMRENKQIEGFYQPLTGIGDDAFAFGHEVNVLVGTPSSWSSWRGSPSTRFRMRTASSELRTSRWMPSPR